MLVHFWTGTLSFFWTGTLNFFLNWYPYLAWWVHLLLTTCPPHRPHRRSPVPCRDSCSRNRLVTLEVNIKVLRVLTAVSRAEWCFKNRLSFMSSSKQELINLRSEMKSSLLIEEGALKGVWFSVLYLTFYVPTWTVSALRAHSERTVSARLNGIWWALTIGELWVSTERKRSTNGSEQWTLVNNMWMQDERFIPSASEVIITLRFAGNQEK